MEAYWFQKEIELEQKHEELVLKREALLRGTEAYYDKQAKQASSFITNYKKSDDRNEQLIEDFKKVRHNLQGLNCGEDQRFTRLKNNYWAMVKNVYHVWIQEQRDYMQRHHLPIPEHIQNYGHKTPSSPRITTPRGRLTIDDQQGAQSITPGALSSRLSTPPISQRTNSPWGPTSPAYRDTSPMSRSVSMSPRQPQQIHTSINSETNAFGAHDRDKQSKSRKKVPKFIDDEFDNSENEIDDYYGNEDRKIKSGSVKDIQVEKLSKQSKMKKHS
ncbi:unnamed protein product [Owenia fusiformis]|uniref:Uncharacterized protein n=1 Tax=Owenia fusiformis TaxID=6347 RepID=A0A8J1TGT4_OWEFU|nr:unnamed protein product [Owenia fusiformis]